MSITACDSKFPSYVVLPYLIKSGAKKETGDGINRKQKKRSYFEICLFEFLSKSLLWPFKTITKCM